MILVINNNLIVNNPNIIKRPLNPLPMNPFSMSDLLSQRKNLKKAKPRKKIKDDKFNMPDSVRSANANVIVPTTSYEITDVPTGTYIFQVRAIDNRGEFSVPAVLEVEVSDSFSGSLPRIFGVLKGGITSAEEVITNDRVSSPVVQTIAFEKDPVFFFSPAA